MSSTMRYLVIVAVLALLLAGCGGGQGAAQAQKGVCDAIGGLDSTVTSLQGVTAETSAQDIKQLKAQLDGAMSALRTANSVIKAEALTGLLATYDTFAQQVDQLADGESIGQALESIQPAMQQVHDSLAQVKTSMKCGQ